MVIHVADGAAQEREKYAEIWTIPEYKNYSPGLENVDRFMSVINPTPGSTLIDVGCGAGVAGLEFQRRGLEVDWLDITDAGLDLDVDRKRFIEAAIWSPEWSPTRAGWRAGWEYGFCCDVLEHLPTEYTMLAIDRVLRCCKTAWLQIALRPDNFGKAIGELLHLTVKPFQWWLVRMATLGKVIDARDLCGDGLFVVERK